MKLFLFFLILSASQISLNSQSIEPIGSGLTMRGSVNDLAKDEANNTMYAVGNFAAIDGVRSNSIAAYSNGTWSALSGSSNINGSILCAEVYDDALYIGGSFTITSEDTIHRLAKYENSKWHSLDLGDYTGPITDLTWYKNELYITGPFRGINGVRHYGIMQYSSGEWIDAGLNSFVNARGLFVSADTLFTWGSGFNIGNEGYSHSVSYLADDQWTTLPNIGSEPSVAVACIRHNGKLYVAVENQIYIFDKINWKWTPTHSLSDESEVTSLFIFKDQPYVIYEGKEIYRIADSGLVYAGIQDVDNSLEGTISTVNTWNGEMMLGGNFIHKESESISLALTSGLTPQAIGQVSSTLTLVDAFNYTVGASICKYNDKYVIAGDFTFANHIYSPNIVYWDGVNFIPFDAPVNDRLFQVEAFENELYAVRWDNSNLIKFDGTRWVSAAAPQGAERIDIINNRLFTSTERYYDSEDGGPHYYQNGSWQKLPEIPDTTFLDYNYGKIRSYNEGYLMIYEVRGEDPQLVFLENDASQWISIGSIEERFDELYTLENEIYLSERRKYILKFNDGKIDTFYENFNIILPYFFEANMQNYMSLWNGETLRLQDQSLSPFNKLNIRDIEAINDSTYIAAMQSKSHSAGSSSIEFNNIALMTFKEPDVSLSHSLEEICRQHYIDYNLISDQLDLSYKWTFEGGTPNTSFHASPVIKYENEGIYTARLQASNIDGETISLSKLIEVNDCGTQIVRENNYDNHWMMGYEFSTGGGIGGFDFTFPDTIMRTKYYPPEEMDNGSIIMSNKEGQLQFYSNGIDLINMDNQPLAGSECFNENLVDYPLEYYIMNQSLICLPNTDDENLYSLFDLDPLSIEGEYWTAASNLSVSKIDMSKNNGKGEVVECNNLIIQDTLLNSTMQATRHKNGHDWWIVVGKYNSDQYYRILMSQSGVIESIELDSWEINYNETFSGQSTFSPDGRLYAQIIRENQNVVIWKFDNESGQLYDQITYSILPIDETEYPQGCSFSSDSRFLYVSSLTQMRQLDLCDYEQVDALLIDSWDGTSEYVFPLLFGKQLMSPQKQILIAGYGNSHRSFGVIKAPNEKGTNCDFQQHDIRLYGNTRNSADVLPIFPHYRNYPSSSLECNTVQTEKIDPTSQFTIFPNPVGSSRVLNFDRTVSGRIYGINGRALHSFNSVKYLDLHTLPNGMYIIETEFGTQKVVLQ